MDKKYWNKTYATAALPTAPSDFAEFCISLFEPNSQILELGCGNGRDSLFFASKGFRVYGCDQSEISIKKLRKLGLDNPVFLDTDVLSFKEKFNVNAIYARFFLHAISEGNYFKILNWIYKNLPPGGIFLSETRSDKTPLEEVGKHFEEHFRRLLNYKDFKSDLESLGFFIEFSEEAKNRAFYKDENPYVIRVVAKK